jgi:uncharacterized protein (TIGR02996 family)
MPAELSLTHDIPFLQAILDQPDDDTPRLIYADWLEERGQAQESEFLRLECRLAWPGGSLAEELAARARFNALREKLDVRWVAKLGVRAIWTRPVPLRHCSFPGVREATGRVARQAGPRGYFAQVKLRLEPLLGTAVVIEDRCEDPWPEPAYWTGCVDGIRDCLIEREVSGNHYRGLRIVIRSFRHHLVDSSRSAFRQAAYQALAELLKN